MCCHGNCMPAHTVCVYVCVRVCIHAFNQILHMIHVHVHFFFSSASVLHPLLPLLSSLLLFPIPSSFPLSSYVLICPHMSSYVLICPHMPSYVLICPHMSSYALICPHMSSYVLICPHMSSYALICPHMPSYALSYVYVFPIIRVSLDERAIAFGSKMKAEVTCGTSLSNEGGRAHSNEGAGAHVHTICLNIHAGVEILFKNHLHLVQVTYMYWAYLHLAGPTCTLTVHAP